VKLVGKVYMYIYLLVWDYYHKDAYIKVIKTGNLW